MKKPLLNILTLDVTGLTDTDFLAHLNTVYDTMVNNPSYVVPLGFALSGSRFAPPVNMAAMKATIDAYTVAVSAAVQGGQAAAVERDKRRGRIGSLQNETLVCLIRLAQDGHPNICGILIEELQRRIHHRALKFCGKMDDYDKEQFCSEVEMQVLELVLSKPSSTEREILEVAFGRKLQHLARNQLKKFKRSVAGNLMDFSVEYKDVEGADARDGIERLKFLPDPKS